MGIELNRFTLHPEPGAYLLFLGRIHPAKGTHTAISVAREAGVPLLIAGIVQDHDYFETVIRPHLDGQAVNYLGPVEPTQRDALLGGAAALLHLIDFDEPFGLSVVEALATGTPVIASARGSLPEIIRPTGRPQLLRLAGAPVGVGNGSAGVPILGRADPGPAAGNSCVTAVQSRRAYQAS